MRTVGEKWRRIPIGTRLVLQGLVIMMSGLSAITGSLLDVLLALIGFPVLLTFLLSKLEDEDA